VTRRLLIILVLAASVLAAPAAAQVTGFYNTKVPERLGKRVDSARKASGVRVLLPSTIGTSFERLYPGGTWGSGRYSLDLGAARGCHQATACFVAAFLAERGSAKPHGRRVGLARGRKGRFTPSRCGASCAAPQIEWREGGVLYTIQAKGTYPGTDRQNLVALANSAIKHGARR
jgi:hypothetical protein